MERKHWRALYTRPRWEKKVNLLLRDKGVESYCPLNKVRRKWSDRMKTVEEPLFKSYVFVRIGKSEMSTIRMTNGVVNFVYWLGKPAVIKDREIETIQKFLGEYKHVEARPINIQPHSKVRIQNGAFMDKEGVVKRLLSNKVEVIIESIGFRLTAFADKTTVEVIEK